LLLAGAGTAHASGTDRTVARLGQVTVAATPLRPGPAGALIASLQVTTSGRSSDQLDAATAANGSPVGLYHQRVSVGEIADLTGCGGDPAPAGVVAHWLHYGPLLVPGSTGATAQSAYATVTVQSLTPPMGRTLAVTFYFARAGAVTLQLPVARV
jgi:hypothetical protein